MPNFRKRTELNPPDSPFCGSVVTYSGPKAAWGVTGPYQYLRISDCGSTVTLHSFQADPPQVLITKLEILQKAVGEFLEELRLLPENVNENPKAHY